MQELLKGRRNALQREIIQQEVQTPVLLGRLASPLYLYRFTTYKQKALSLPDMDNSEVYRCLYSLLDRRFTLAITAVARCLCLESSHSWHGGSRHSVE